MRICTGCQCTNALSIIRSCELCSFLSLGDVHLSLIHSLCSAAIFPQTSTVQHRKFAAMVSLTFWNRFPNIWWHWSFFVFLDLYSSGSMSLGHEYLWWSSLEEAEEVLYKSSVIKFDVILVLTQNSLVSTCLSTTDSLPSFSPYRLIGFRLSLSAYK